MLTDKSKSKDSVSRNRTSIQKKDTNIVENENNEGTPSTKRETKNSQNASKLITHGNKETTTKPLQPKIKSPKLRIHTENSTSSVSL